MAHVSTPTRRPTHVVVIGAGMGGLAAAQALSRHVTRVTIVERDSLPARPAPRSGTPQGRHLHALMPGGLAALERLLPGFGDELSARGAISLAVPRDVLWLSAAGWMQPYTSQPRTLLSASRDLIECVTRELVLDRTPVGLRTGVEVGGLAIEDGRVVGVDADLAYATRTYRRGGDDLGGWKAIFLQARPPHTTRMGVLFPIEDDRWMLTVAGTNGDVPPTDEDGFLAFTRGLRSPAIADVVERLEPLTPIVGYRRTENRRRHYETLRRASDGFVAIDDATCAFNPVYAQGMSAAALTAEVLDKGLRDHLARSAGDLAGASAGLQKGVAKANAGAWMVATGEDMRWPETEGGSTSAADRLVRRYLDRVVAAAAVDPVVTEAFFDVVALLAEPTSLMRPTMAVRVLTRRRPAPSTTPPAPLSAAVTARAS